MAENDLLETIPIDPIVLANKVETEVNASFKDPEIAGAIMTKEGKTTIFVNVVDSYERKRFTIAHELGHYHLHLSGQNNRGFIDMYRSLSGKGSQAERQANSFAAALLMDRAMVIKVWDELPSIIGTGYMECSAERRTPAKKHICLCICRNTVFTVSSNKLCIMAVGTW